MEIKIDYSQLDVLITKLNGTPKVVKEELIKGMVEAEALLWRMSVLATPKKTGLLRDSIKGSGVQEVGDGLGVQEVGDGLGVQEVGDGLGVQEVGDGLGVEAFVGTSLNYAIPVELGTRPHEIVATGRALAFSWKGKEVVVKSVHHPGTKGAHMFARTLKTYEPAIHKIFDDVQARIVSRIM